MLTGVLRLVDSIPVEIPPIGAFRISKMVLTGVDPQRNYSCPFTKSSFWWLPVRPSVVRKIIGVHISQHWIGCAIHRRTRMGGFQLIAWMDSQTTIGWLGISSGNPGVFRHLLL